MEPIKIEDPKLAAKVDRIVAQLKEYYPDGKVIRITNDHKKLSERIGKAYKEIGYPSRDAFFAAYGFEANKAGHPFTTDAKEVFVELHRRYDGKALCASPSQLIEENPDLKGKLKTLQNNSQRDFGDVFKNVLIGEGLLAGEKREAARKFTRAEMDEALEELAGRIKEDGIFTKTMASLQKAYPDYSDALTFLGRVSSDWYGLTPRKVLQERGILVQSGALGVNQDEILSWLKEAYSSLPNDEKPASIDELIAANPDKSAELKEAQRKWKANHEETFLSCLKQNGVIKMSEAALRNRLKETAPFCLRNAKLKELVSLWKKVGGPKNLTRENEEDLVLPERVAAIDVDLAVEIRRSYFHAIVHKNELEQHAVKVGTPLSCSASDPFIAFEAPDGYRLINRRVGKRRWSDSDPSPFDEYADCKESAWKDSPVAGLVGAWIESTSQDYYGCVLVCVRFDYPHKLTTQTMINLLYKNGVLTDDDMLGGDDWRTREYEKLSFEGAALAEDSGGDSAAGSAPEPEPESGPDSESEPESEVEPASESGPEPELEPEPEPESEPDSESEIESESESNGPTREDKLSLARLAVTAAQLVGVATFPQEFLDKLERAEQGDMSIDPDELLKEINDMTPDEHSVDAASLTFDEGRVARGKHFDVAIPDGWHVVENYERDGLFGQKRPFVAVPEHVSNDDIELSNRIIYVDSGDRAVKLGQTSSFMTAPLRWAMFCQAHYVEMANQMTNPTSPFAAFAQKTMWDCEVDAQNTKCFILQYNSGTGINGLEFNIRPYSLDHSDYLRVCLSMDENIDIDAVREVVKRIAATVELDKPFESDAERDLKAAFGKKLTKDEFTDLASRIASPIPNFFQELFTAGQNRYVFQLNGEEVDARDATIAGARMLAEYGEKIAPYYDKLLDLYTANDSFGETKAADHEAYELLHSLFYKVFPGIGLFSGGEKRWVLESGVLNAPAKKESRERLEALFPKGEAKLLRLEDVVPRGYIDDIKKWGKDFIPNDGVARELVDRGKECVVPSILRSRQEQIDALIGMSSDSASTLEAIREEAGRYNAILFELASRYKTILERMIPKEALDGSKRFLVEINDILELMSDSIETNNQSIGTLRGVALPAGISEFKQQLRQLDDAVARLAAKNEKEQEIDALEAKIQELENARAKIPGLEQQAKMLSSEIDKMSFFSFSKKKARKAELAQCQAQLESCRSQAALIDSVRAEHEEAKAEFAKLRQA